MLSCGQVKTELFENADVTASIYYISYHALRSLGIMRGHFACLCTSIEIQMSNFECSRSAISRVENAPHLDADIFDSLRIKKMRFQKDPDTCGRSLSGNYFVKIL